MGDGEVLSTILIGTRLLLTLELAAVDPPRGGTGISIGVRGFEALAAFFFSSSSFAISCLDASLEGSNFRVSLKSAQTVTSAPG